LITANRTSYSMMPRFDSWSSSRLRTATMMPVVSITEPSTSSCKRALHTKAAWVKSRPHHPFTRTLRYTYLKGTANPLLHALNLLLEVAAKVLRKHEDFMLEYFLATPQTQQQSGARGWALQARGHMHVQ